MTMDARSTARQTPLEKAIRRDTTLDNTSTLQRKTRVGEEVIRTMLLFCGVVSIFTTIGIVVVLGRDSALFFQSDAWLAVKRFELVEDAPTIELTQPLRANDTLFATGELDNETRRNFLPGRALRVEDEVMLIVERATDGLIVERGFNGTQARLHDVGTFAAPMSEVLVRTTSEMAADETSIDLEDGTGSLFTAGDRIQMSGSGETMRVLEVTGDTLILERSLDEIPAADHDEGETVRLPDNPTFLEFVTNTQWQPQVGEFGILPLVSSTLTTSFIAMLVAIPLGLGSAIYLSEYARPEVRGVLKPILEILAGVPTVVYGYFAIQFMTPLLQGLTPDGVIGVYNMLSAGLVMGIMILPTISSMSEDALSAVPDQLRQASVGLGATRLETTSKVVFPAALSGIVAAFIVGISRAVGETMIVAIAAGARPNFTFNPTQAAETMTGHIARISGGDLSYDTIDYNSIFIIGLTLFVITLILNLISGWISRRFREAY
ncbi:MAG: phosphate ABC transporter permease subunit PstC [Chloroflexota bacterium]